MEFRYGAAAVEIVHTWQSLLDDMRDKGEIDQLRETNNFFNDRIRFSTDNEIWQTKDYWATPIETMGRQMGDCEDFTIAKYITLLHLKLPANKLRLVYVKAILATGQKQAHMVLAYYPTPNAEPLILDNLNLNILPASKRQDLVPVFSFNSEGLWVGQDVNPRIKQAETRLSNWRDVILRMQAEGIYEQ